MPAYKKDAYKCSKDITSIGSGKFVKGNLKMELSIGYSLRCGLIMIKDKILLSYHLFDLSTA